MHGRLSRTAGASALAVALSALGAGSAGASHVGLKGNFEPTWSADGSEIVFTSSRDGNENLYLMRVDGSRQRRLTSDPADEYEADWSRDGRIAFTKAAPDEEIYVMNGDGSGLRQLTNDPGNWDFKPDWSPDGTQIAFVKTNGSRIDVYVVGADGSGLRNLTSSVADDVNSAPAWSPDGTQIAFSSGPSGSRGRAISVVNVDGSGLRKLTSGNATDLNADWSPDGQSIAFSRSYDEIYVIRVDGSGERRLDAGRGADFPAWSPDARRIAFAAQPLGHDADIVVSNADGSHRTVITVPSARAHCVVPRVIGKRVRAARAAIVERNCAVGRVTWEPARAKRGVVVAQSPRAGMRLHRGAKVNLRVSQGRP